MICKRFTANTLHYYSCTIFFLLLFGVRSVNHMEPVSSWPKGTSAQGSTLHPPNIVKDKPRSYNDSFAIDGDQVTFWNECVFLGEPKLPSSIINKTL